MALISAATIMTEMPLQETKAPVKERQHLAAACETSLQPAYAMLPTIRLECFLSAQGQGLLGLSGLSPGPLRRLGGA